MNLQLLKLHLTGQNQDLYDKESLQRRGSIGSVGIIGSHQIGEVKLNI